MLADSLTIAGPDGQETVLFQKGAQAPAVARAVFATQRAGERALAFRLFEGAGKGRRLVGSFAAELPAGLPGNTWLAVFVNVGEDHALKIAVKENLRRLDIEPECDLAGAKAKVFKVG